MDALTRTDDNYRNAKTIAQDAVCQGGHELQVIWAADHYEAACVTPGCEARGIVTRRELEQRRIRERLEQDPQLSRQLAVAGTNVPMTTAAIKELSRDEMGKRVDDAFGANALKGSPELRGALLGLALTYGLDPLFDLSTQFGTPYITYEGRMRKLRESPNFRREKELRPLTKDEKEEWGFAPGDIVVKCTVDMGPKGEMFDFGVVRAAGETSAVAKSHPQLLAIKRARARVSRVATGIDLPTLIESDGRVIDIEPLQPSSPPASGEERGRRRFWAIAHGAPPDGLGLDDERVHELLRVDTVNGYPGGWDAALRDLTERAAETQSEPERPPVTMQSVLGQRFATLLEEAAALELDVEDLKVSFPADYEHVVRMGERLRDRIDDAHRATATEAE